MITLLPLTRFVKKRMYLSDHHKLIVTVLRSTFGKEKSRKMFYRCYKNFDNNRFEEELQKNRSQYQILNHSVLHLKSLSISLLL